MRRVKPTPGSQLALLATYAYHPFITDRDGDTVELEADHRRHAEVENAIRDLKYGVGLNHLPSGRFGANAAWLVLNVIAHNMARWTSRIGLGETQTGVSSAAAVPRRMVGSSPWLSSRRGRVERHCKYRNLLAAPSTRQPERFVLRLWAGMLGHNGRSGTQLDGPDPRPVTTGAVKGRPLPAPPP